MKIFPKSSNDPVNHPEHYARFVPEPIDVFDSWADQLHIYQYSALQYIIRADAKGGAEDIDKAIFYLERWKSLLTHKE